MSIKAIIPSGMTELTVHGLHQWDYGRKLEITAEGLPGLVEVHFACRGMAEAVVRSCALIDNTLTAAIPDSCLEQTTPIVAWVYGIGETSGETLLTINLPIIARTRPEPGATVPEDTSDRYTQAIAAMNALVDEYEIIVENAKEDIKEQVANELYNEGVKAKTADYADEAGHAESAGAATTAETDTLGYPLTTCLHGDAEGFAPYTSGSSIEGGLMVFRMIADTMDVRLFTEVGGRRSTSYTSVFYWTAKGTQLIVRLKFTHAGEGFFTITPEVYSDGEWSEEGFTPEIYYQYLSKKYPVG